MVLILVVYVDVNVAIVDNVQKIWKFIKGLNQIINYG